MRILSTQGGIRVKKLLLVIVLIGAVFLAGCDFLAFIEDLVDRISNPGGGGIGGVTFVQIIVEYNFDLDVMTQGPVFQPDMPFASIESIGPLVFDPDTTTYTVVTPPESDPYVMMSIQLDESGSEIRDLVVERRMSDSFGWERLDNFVAYDIPYHRAEGDSTFYRIDVTMPQWIGLGRVDYRSWMVATQTELAPMYWVVDPSDKQVVFDADPYRYIEIEFRQ